MASANIGTIQGFPAPATPCGLGLGTPGPAQAPGYGFPFSSPARCAALDAAIFTVSLTLSGTAADP